MANMSIDLNFYYGVMIPAALAFLVAAMLWIERRGEKRRRNVGSDD